MLFGKFLSAQPIIKFSISPDQNRSQICCHLSLHSNSSSPALLATACDGDGLASALFLSQISRYHSQICLSLANLTSWP